MSTNGTLPVSNSTSRALSDQSRGSGTGTSPAPPQSISVSPSDTVVSKYNSRPAPLPKLISAGSSAEVALFNSSPNGSPNGSPGSSPQPISGGTGTSPPAPTSQSTSGNRSSGVGTLADLAGSVGGILGALIIVAMIWVLIRKKKLKWRLGSRFLSSFSSMKKVFGLKEVQIESTPGGEPNLESVSQHPEVSKAFTYQELKQATHGFSPLNLLGEGGFGRVYKATIAGNLVAVKQLTHGSGQGEREFRAEVDIISRVHHRHLVSLVGYCISRTERLLVYKYVPNGTLENALHSPGRPCMDWATRMNIALGTARGLAYLHEDCHPRIIHRDIKGSNILLDDQWEAQVSDFGLAKLADDVQTHVTTRVMGTFGYLAPEYAMSGKLTSKSDVYSFGVVLLELITGKKPVDKTLHAAEGEESLVEWARPLLTQALETGNVDAVVDPNLNGKYDKEEMFRMVEVAATCVRHSFQKRPKMVEALRHLASQEGDLHQGALPGYSTEYTGDDVRKFRQLAFSSFTSKSSSDYKGVSRSDTSIPSTSSNEI